MKQSTYETCLACCLLMAVDGPQKDEIEVWKHGWKFNYLIGQLNYVAEKYGKKFEVYVENKYYFNQLLQQKNKNIILLNKKIEGRLLNKFLEEGDAIVYIDNYYLQKILHTPHFVIAKKRVGGAIEIVDPFDGRKKRIPVAVVNKAITSLRNHLKYSPILIRMK
jgi:hypothetical protein